MGIGFKVVQGLRLRTKATTRLNKRALSVKRRCWGILLHHDYTTWRYAEGIRSSSSSLRA